MEADLGEVLLYGCVTADLTQIHTFDTVTQLRGCQNLQTQEKKNN